MIKIKEIAAVLGGTVIGDGNVLISRIIHSDHAVEGDIACVLDEKALLSAEKSKASAILTAYDIGKSEKTIIKVDDLKTAATLIYNMILEAKNPVKGEIHPSAIISKEAVIGKNVIIGANVSIGKKAKIGDNTTIDAGCVIEMGASIGERCRLYPNVTLYEYVELGNNVTIHSGSVIGSDGFGYIPREGKILKVPQLGKVIIGDNVELGSNTCVDRGTFDNTVIGRDTKIDSLVQIAHNVKIGRGVFLAAQTGVAGSANVGDGVMAGGQVGISDHINIAPHKRLAAKTGVIGHIRADGPNEYFGYPAREAREALKQMAFLAWLSKHSRKIMKMVKGLSQE
ncbi:MAG: UDP-3-O-(3-hydroxymyristoyl)glucosamine N-acyltransferase [Candidatus Omnitrophota bacterium]